MSHVGLKVRYLLKGKVERFIEDVKPLFDRMGWAAPHSKEALRDRCNKLIDRFADDFPNLQYTSTGHIEVYQRPIEDGHVEIGLRCAIEDREYIELEQTE